MSITTSTNSGNFDGSLRVAVIGAHAMNYTVNVNEDK